MSWWPVAMIVFGINFTVWATIGLARLTEEAWRKRTLRGKLRHRGFDDGPAMTMQEIGRAHV